MSPGRSLGVQRPRGVGGLGREHTGTVQATHRVMLVLFHLVRMNIVRGIFEFYRQFWIFYSEKFSPDAVLIKTRWLLEKTSMAPWRSVRKTFAPTFW